MKSIAVLITSYNRREKTLKCLSLLSVQKINSNVQVEVFLVDDGSTDGTSIAIKEQFPEVNIISGNGDLFWNRGMHKAWSVAENTKEYDYFIWLNDDTYLFDDALETFLKVSEMKNNEAIIVGVTTSSGTDKITYGGREKDILIQLNGTPRTCTTFNGNCVLIPNSVWKVLGKNDPYFHHSFGDIEYGLRAEKNGIMKFITPKSIGYCENHNVRVKCFNKDYSFMSRLTHLYSPLGINPVEFFYMNLKYFGIFKACKVFVSNHLMVCFPKLWNR